MLLTWGTRVSSVGGVYSSCVCLADVKWGRFSNPLKVYLSEVALSITKGQDMEDLHPIIKEHPLWTPTLSTWREIQQILTEITGFPIGLYNFQREPVVPPSVKNRLEELVCSTEKGRDILNRFYRRAFDRSLSIDRPLILSTPLNQHIFVIPMEVDKEAPLFIIGGYTYLRYEDFSKAVENAKIFDLKEEQMASLAQEVIIRDFKTLEAIANFIHVITTRLLTYSISADRTLLLSRKQRALLSLLPGLVTSPSREEMMKQIFQAFCVLFDAEAMGVMAREGERFATLYAFGERKGDLKGLKIGVGEPTLERVVGGKPLYIDDVFFILEMGFGDWVQSLYILPLLKEKETIGLIYICNARMEEEERETIGNLISFLSFLWNYYDIKNELERTRHEFLILTEIHKAIGSILEEDRLYQAIIDKSTELTGAEQASIMILDPESKELIVRAAKGINKALIEHLRLGLGEGIAGKVCETSEPLVVDNVEESLKKKNRPRYKTKSFVIVPLKIDGRTIGVLNITDKITGEVFSRDDLRLLQSFASYASIAIERVEFFKMSEDLRKISITDSLTGLLNRRYFQGRLAEELERARRHNHPLSLMMIDIDDFKPFNDTRGHLAGDDALRLIGRTIREAVRTIDIVARYGGEEFAVILPQTDKRASRFIAERIRREVEGTVFPHKELPPARLTISLGIAAFPEDAKGLTDLINLADKALYRAKALGKNRVCLYGEEGP